MEKGRWRGKGGGGGGKRESERGKTGAERVQGKAEEGKVEVHSMEWGKWERDRGKGEAEGKMERQRGKG